MPATSPAIEDYLKTVYAHTEWQPDPITPKVLADRLGVAPSSVTEMVKKMAAAGLVSHVPYGAVRLTDAGLARALAVVRRHRLIETWLVQEMGYGWDEVHDEAEILEHAISDRLLEAIDAPARPTRARPARRRHPVGRRHARAAPRRAPRRRRPRATRAPSCASATAIPPCCARSTTRASASTRCSRSRMPPRHPSASSVADRAHTLPRGAAQAIWVTA